MSQSSSLDFKLVQRVCLLQQALDQALEALADLKHQVQDKQWIEAQLANTEKYANVQQQAIARLKEHLGQFAGVQQNLLSVMAYRLNELIDQQQVEFHRLRIQVQQSQTEVQTYLQCLHGYCALDQDEPRDEVTLEAEVMMARAMTVSLSRQMSLAVQHLDVLTADLGEHHLNLSHIIQTARAMIADLSSFELLSDSQMFDPNSAIGADEVDSSDAMANYSIDAASEDITVLKGTVRRQDLRIHELETVLMEQFEQRTQLKQRFQALSAERDYYKRQLEAAKAANASTSQPPTATPATRNRPITEADTESLLPPATDAPPQSAPYSNLLPHPRLRSRPHPPIQPLKLKSDEEL